MEKFVFKVKGVYIICQISYIYLTKFHIIWGEITHKGTDRDHTLCVTFSTLNKKYFRSST